MKANVRRLVLAALSGLATGFIASLVCHAHVYRVTSGCSDRPFFVVFRYEPSEMELFDAVVEREPFLKHRLRPIIEDNERLRELKETE